MRLFSCSLGCMRRSRVRRLLSRGLELEKERCVVKEDGEMRWLSEKEGKRWMCIHARHTGNADFGGHVLVFWRFIHCIFGRGMLSPRLLTIRFFASPSSRYLCYPALPSRLAIVSRSVLVQTYISILENGLPCTCKLWTCKL